MPCPSNHLSPPAARRDYDVACGGFLRFVFPWRIWRSLRDKARTLREMRESGLVDADWYLREHPDAAARGADPVADFLELPNVLLRKPNPDFDPQEYAALNFDVFASSLPPAVHYARDGRREGRPVSELDLRADSFPPGAAEFRREFAAVPPACRRTAVFACFPAGGRIADTVPFYLRGLREVVDNVVFVANGPVFPEEASKLEGLVRLAVFRHHGGYDFGSYKAGWEEAKALGLLEPGVADEIVFCNDSCYGPVFPFGETFAEMARRQAESGPEDKFDFWGLTGHTLFGTPHVQSYFAVFGPSVLESGALDRFFAGYSKRADRGQVVFFGETALSAALCDEGLRFETLVPADFSLRRKNPPIKFPVTLFSRWRMPLLKAKTWRGESAEPLDSALEAVRRANPALAALLPPPAASAVRGCPVSLCRWMPFGEG